MSKIPMSPKARKFAEENNIDLNSVSPTGKDGSIRYVRFSDVENAKITPLAKKIAEHNGIDHTKITSVGKIKKEDILSVIGEISSGDAFTLTKARKALADNLSDSIKETIPYTVFAKVDISEAYEAYEKMKGAYDVKITLTDIFVYAISCALKENIIINTTRKGGYYIRNNSVNISLAVDINGNIITPVINSAENLSVYETALKRTELLGKISSGRITSSDLEGGTFTVSNLGNSPVGHFTPVINHPQSAIMGIGRTDDELYLSDGKIMTKKVTHLSLTADHTIIDGMTAAKFLSDVERFLSEVE